MPCRTATCVHGPACRGTGGQRAITTAPADHRRPRPQHDHASGRHDASERSQRTVLVSGRARRRPARLGRLDGSRFLPALVFPCDRGRAPITGRSCYETATDLPDIAWLRNELRAGRIKGFGELSPQYLGMSVADDRFDGYWRLAEEFDIPVGVHLGPGPQGVAYQSSRVPFKSPAFRMSFGDPLVLEEVLLRHKRLRLFVMHAGWPHLEAMVALLYAHPNVYVDVAGLQSQRLVTARGVLTGTCEVSSRRVSPSALCSGPSFPDQLGEGIDAILAADLFEPDAEGRHPVRQRGALPASDAVRVQPLNASQSPARLRLRP